MEHKEVATAYFHIGNGGVSFSVLDKGHGPVIKVDSSHFGNNVTSQEVFVRQEDLIVLARLFDEAANYEGYSSPYCYAAQAESSYPYSLIDGFAPEHGGLAGCDSYSDKEIQDLVDLSVGMLDHSDDPFVGSSCCLDEEEYDCCCDFEFVANEQTDVSPGTSTVSTYHVLHNAPLIPGTLTGAICLKDKPASYTFVTASEKTSFFFTPTVHRAETDATPIAGSIDFSLGALTIVWDKEPGINYCVVNYEYEPAMNWEYEQG